MVTLYKGKKVEVIGEFLLPKCIMFGIEYTGNEIGFALGIIGVTVEWSVGGEDD